jgi:hypothetical protein
MQATASIAHGTSDSSLTASSVWGAPISGDGMDRLEGDHESNGSFVRGAFVALGMEAAMVLMACGIWHLIR